MMSILFLGIMLIGGCSTETKETAIDLEGISETFKKELEVKTGKEITEVDNDDLQTLDYIRLEYEYEDNETDKSQDFEVISQLSSLEELDIIRGSVKEKSLQLISNVNTLKTLYISENDLIDLSFLPLQLSLLDITSGNIKDVSAIEQLKELTSLTLIGNNLNNIDIDHIKELKQLIYVNLIGNQITEIEPLKELTLLSTLRLSDNKITNVDVISDLSQLVFVTLDNNNIKSLPPLNKLTQLRHLNISHNPIEHIDIAMENLNIQQLDMSDTNIADLSPIEQLTKLKYIDIRNTNVTSIQPLIHLSELKDLELIFEQIQDIELLDEDKIFISEDDIIG